MTTVGRRWYRVAPVLVLAASYLGLGDFVATAFGYTKPNTYRRARTICTPLTPTSRCDNVFCLALTAADRCAFVFTPSSIVFKEQYPLSPHSWVIPKAIGVLRKDGFESEAKLAEQYLLPMLEGVTFNDVWGDADIAGASVLDYYVPNKPDQDYGYGCDQYPFPA